MKTIITDHPTTHTGVSAMKNRLFWGTPHTETDALAFEAAMQARAEEAAAGKFAAVDAVERGLEGISRRSGALAQFNTLLALVTMLLAYRSDGAAALFMQFNTWAFIAALASCVLLLPNLALVWPGQAAHTVRNAREAYLFALGFHKVRAARYTVALVLSFVAAVLTLASLTQMA